MNAPLNKDSKMECRRHGTQKPAFICQHLQYGVGIGFFEPEEEPDPEWPFRNAWCAECEAVTIEQGGWNDISEGFARVIPICEGCYEEIRRRNT